MRYNDSRYNIY